MLTRTLNTLKRLVRRSGLRGVLARTGLLGLGRGVLARRVLRRGWYETVLLGRRLRFVVSDPQEIIAIDNMTREAAFLGRLVAALGPGDVLYDVGANLGVVSLLAVTGPAGVHVHAFEPEPQNADHLRRTIALNRADDRITVHELGLASEAGRAPLYVDGRAGFGRGSILAGAVGAGERVEIELARGADVARRLGVSPTAVKIDVEGAEMAVLSGMDEFFEDGTVRDAFVEVHPDRLEAAGSSADALDAWLRDRNYEVAWSERRGGEVHCHYRRRPAGD